VDLLTNALSSSQWQAALWLGVGVLVGLLGGWLVDLNSIRWNKRITRLQRESIVAYQRTVKSYENALDASKAAETAGQKLLEERRIQVAALQLENNSLTVRLRNTEDRLNRLSGAL
jgi:hypothetical protein